MVNTPSLTAVKFINNLTGYAVDNYGVILKTTNGGMPLGINTLSTSHNIKENWQKELSGGISLT